MASITQALKIEDNWYESTCKAIGKIWETRNTISDIMEDSAVHVRNSEFGDVSGVELTTYEKKLVMLGFIIAHKKGVNDHEQLIMKAIISEIIREGSKGKSKEEEE
jgi:hypothetical protein